jgi:hypothetical protein
MRIRKGNYEVGYRRPPKASQFSPGKSGNPKGRPKHTKTVDEMFADELNRTLVLRSNDGSTRISVRLALIRQFLKLAANGHPKALFASLDKFEVVQRKQAKEDATRAAPKYTREMIAAMSEGEKTALYMKLVKQAKGEDEEGPDLIFGEC